MSEQETTERTIETLAAEARECFEVARRATGDTDTGPREDGEPYVRVREGSPAWITDLVREAHGHDPRGGPLMLPDDWRYVKIADALEAIAEGTEDHDYADGAVDVYNAGRLAWLASHGLRASYVDEGRELGLIGPETDMIDAIGAGQYAEALEIYAEVRAALEARLLEDGDA